MRIEISSRQNAVSVAPGAIEELLALVLREERRDAELSIALVGEQEMIELNKRFLHEHRSTDVLAFPYDCEGTTVNGEIVANAECALQEAAARKHPAEDELMLYLVHGLLHLLGYDDQEPPRALCMHKRERDLLRAAGRTAPL
jgi:probable rRNA maturation factor